MELCTFILKALVFFRKHWDLNCIIFFSSPKEVRPDQCQFHMDEMCNYMISEFFSLVWLNSVLLSPIKSD